MKIRTIVFPILIILASFQISCVKKESKITETEPAKTDSTKSIVETNDLITTKQPKAYTSNYISTEDVLVNGHNVFFKKTEFDALYKNKIDSTRTDVWDCGTPFEWLDDKWMTEKYGPKSKEGDLENFNGEITTLFGKGITLSTNNHMVLFDTGYAENNSLTIVSHNIRLDKNTTLEDFKKWFPKAEIEKMDKPNEVRFRFSIEKNIEDSFLFYFKDGKLEYFTLWWLLC